MLRILLVGMAIASGGAAAWLVGSMGVDANGAGETAMSATAIHTEEVLVAAADVEQGAALGVDQMRWQVWPRERTQSAFILRSARPEAPVELAGSIARSHLVAGTPLFAKSLAPAGSSLLSAALTPGKRAVAIKVSAEKSAGGFILPNDRVDVLLTVKCRPEDGCSSSVSVRTIMRNVRVLAIDQSGGKDNSETSLVGKTATLELDPEEAEAIIGAEASGTLALVLRSATDNGPGIEGPERKNRTMRVMREGVSEYVTLP
ncbi:MAG TPA: Flp pilus assembly protein CpaB [Aestuariivirgaceae bacterium]|nr:Flp pilus assembly protein CpaB [Aestuariivirgaceae bacterium]